MATTDSIERTGAGRLHCDNGMSARVTVAGELGVAMAKERSGALPDCST
jgi:hypothetical protein